MKCPKCGKKQHDAEIQGYYRLSLIKCAKCGNESLIEETDLAKIVHGKRESPIQVDLTVPELIEMLKENKLLKSQYAKGMDLQLDLSLEEDGKKE